MPRHLADGVNVQKGTITFNGTKWMQIDFAKAFKTSPAVSISPLDSENTPTYKVVATPEHFTITFKVNWTGSVTWRAEE